MRSTGGRSGRDRWTSMESGGAQYPHCKRSYGSRTALFWKNWQAGNCRTSPATRSCWQFWHTACCHRTPALWRWMDGVRRSSPKAVFHCNSRRSPGKAARRHPCGTVIRRISARAPQSQPRYLPQPGTAVLNPSQASAKTRSATYARR